MYLWGEGGGVTVVCPPVGEDTLLSHDGAEDGSVV